MNKSLLIADNVERPFYYKCIYKWLQNTLYVFLDIDYSNRVYQSFVVTIQKYFLLCWHYA